MFNKSIFTELLAGLMYGKTTDEYLNYTRIQSQVLNKIFIGSYTQPLRRDIVESLYVENQFGIKLEHLLYYQDLGGCECPKELLKELHEVYLERTTKKRRQGLYKEKTNPKLEAFRSMKHESDMRVLINKYISHLGYLNPIVSSAGDGFYYARTSQQTLGVLCKNPFNYSDLDKLIEMPGASEFVIFTAKDPGAERRCNDYLSKIGIRKVKYINLGEC